MDYEYYPKILFDLMYDFFYLIILTLIQIHIIIVNQ